jgi:hypothetical protein
LDNDLQLITANCRAVAGHNLVAAIAQMALRDRAAPGSQAAAMTGGNDRKLDQEFDAERHPSVHRQHLWRRFEIVI